MTVCSYIKHKSKKDMSQTQAVAGINSLNSKNPGTPQILCNTTKGCQESQEDNRRKSVASISEV